jgi:hypothetical protein
MRAARHAMLSAAALACFCAALPEAARGLSPHDGDHGGSDFGSALRRVIHAGREQFAPLKSFRVDIRPGRNSWYEVKASLPGADTCRIYEHPQPVYRCEWRRKREAGAASGYPELVRRVEAALGDEWSRVNRGKSTRFASRKPRSGRIEVRAGETLQLVIYAPAVE